MPPVGLLAPGELGQALWVEVSEVKRPRPWPPVAAALVLVIEAPAAPDT